MLNKKGESHFKRDYINAPRDSMFPTFIHLEFSLYRYLAILKGKLGSQRKLLRITLQYSDITKPST